LINSIGGFSYTGNPVNPGFSGIGVFNFINP
jgi:hypothetical protein